MSQMEDKKEALKSLNELFKQTAQFFNSDYKLLIYHLLKRGHVKIVHLSEDSGLSESRLYQIVDEVSKKIEGEGETT